MERKEHLQQNYQFRTATEADVKFLLAIDRKVSMPSQYGIHICFLHEPDFFTAARAGNDETQVIVCEDISSNQIVGVGSRCIRQAFINGQKQSIGYLSNLRGLPEHRGPIRLVTEGYNYLKKLHQDGKVPFYITTILEENVAVQKLLTSKRFGLPTYNEYGRYETHLIPLYRRERGVKTSKSVQKATLDDIDQIVDFIIQEMSRYQFAPYYRAEDFRGGTESLPKFDVQNIYIYRQNGEIKGMIGIWDQSSFKQVVVDRFEDSKIKLLRPFYNTWSKIAGGLQLPKEGEQFKNLYTLMVAARNDDPEVFTSLLDHIIADWSRRGYTNVIVGFEERHPLCKFAKQRASNTLLSRMYLVYWDGNVPELPSKDNVFHLEVATL